MQTPLTLDELEKRDYARMLIARQLYASDITAMIVTRFAITREEASRVCRETLIDVEAANTPRDPADIVRGAIAFWASIVSDPKQPLDIQMHAMDRITHLVTEKRPKKPRRSATPSNEAIEREAAHAVAVLDSTDPTSA